MPVKVLVLGAGEVATGVIYRLFQAGCQVLATELELPLSVRRTVSFSEAVYINRHIVEGVHAQLITELGSAQQLIEKKIIPVIVDKKNIIKDVYKYDVLIDARMLKEGQTFFLDHNKLIIGLGPGFRAGINCNVVIETNRGHFLGRVYWSGKAESDTGIPEAVSGYRKERVIRAPVSGVYHQIIDIGKIVSEEDVIGVITGKNITAPFKGLLRGIVHDGIYVSANMKIGDIDPRCNKDMLKYISDKALAIGGACLTTILTIPEYRNRIGETCD